MASGSPVPHWQRSFVLHCKVVAYLLINISHTVSGLVQLLLQPRQVCIRVLSRYWAAGVQTAMNTTSELLKKTLLAILKKLVMDSCNQSNIWIIFIYTLHQIPLLYVKKSVCSRPIFCAGKMPKTPFFAPRKRLLRRLVSSILGPAVNSFPSRSTNRTAPSVRRANQNRSLPKKGKKGIRENSQWTGSWVFAFVRHFYFLFIFFYYFFFTVRGLLNRNMILFAGRSRS